MVVSSKLFLVTFAVLIVSGLTAPPYVDVKDSTLKDIPHRFVGNVRCKDGSKILPGATLLVWDYDFLHIPHRFVGNVRCKDGSKILPGAKLLIWDYDFISGDDLLLTIPLVAGKHNERRALWDYRLSTNDGLEPLPYSEVYYQFLNVCFDGQDVLVEPKVFSPDDELLGDVGFTL
uniref:Uncharacterized protein n=1 Tax=Panagrolaimus sp. PS1159 TaxID=55785 RepID=A0AC35GQC5_9BILA